MSVICGMEVVRHNFIVGMHDNIGTLSVVRKSPHNQYWLKSNIVHCHWQLEVSALPSDRHHIVMYFSLHTILCVNICCVCYEYDMQLLENRT